MIEREIPWASPSAAFERLACEKGALLLCPGARADSARWAFIAARPSELLEARGRAATINGASAGAAPFEALAALHESRRRTGAAFDGPPLMSGLAGFVGYECGALLEPSAPALPSGYALPDLCIGAYDAVAAFDLARRRALLFARDARTADALHDALADHEAAEGPTDLVAYGSNFSPRAYRAAVADARERILAGDFFQANLSQRLEFRAERPIDAYALFRAAQRNSSAPFAAFIPCGDASIISMSPERFFAVDAESRILAEPIKGTRPRGKTPDEDARLARELADSPKERAENVMIADLTRNDLSRLCEDGSIVEEGICALVSHSTVHHLVSRISGGLLRRLTPVDALKSMFPCGSVTGAPKIEAMKAIAAIEGVGRGPYCGAIGYVDDRGLADFSVAIRIAIVEGARVTAPVGGGVTLRSDPDAEYQETLAKAAWLTKLAGPKERDGAP
jgi:para-aminobenzoate synthetase component 1